MCVSFYTYMAVKLYTYNKVLFLQGNDIRPIYGSLQKTNNNGCLLWILYFVSFANKKQYIFWIVEE